jgi:hypothetical protein
MRTGEPRAAKAHMATVDSPAVLGLTLERTAVAEPTERAARLADEKSLLRWGGLAGLIGGIIFVVSIGYQVGVLGTQTTASGDGPIIRFPAIQSQIVLGQTLFLVATVLLVPLFLTLYRALRGPSIAGALFGTGLSFLGVAVLAVESEPNVAMASISAQYHAAGATAAQQVAAVISWQATQGVFNEFDTCAFAFLSAGLILLGIAMIYAPAFGKIFGGMTAVFGGAGLLGLSIFSVTSAGFSLFALLTFVVFPIVLGWKLYRLSRVEVTPARPTAGATSG